MKPENRREWGFLAAGAVLAAVALAVALPRYEVRQAGEGLAYLKVDRWTGAVARCGAACRPVKEDDGSEGFVEAPAKGPTTPSSP